MFTTALSVIAKHWKWPCVQVNGPTNLVHARVEGTAPRTTQQFEGISKIVLSNNLNAAQSQKATCWITPVIQHSCHDEITEMKN